MINEYKLLLKLFKVCPDPKWIGEICQKIGGQDVNLDLGQRMIMEILAGLPEDDDDQT